MATLQAARAFELGLPLESAYSWGLNRAIFYAAAKRGFKGKPASPVKPSSGKPKMEKVTQPYPLGDEMAYSEETDGKVYFVIGGKAQTQSDFEKQIESRFGGSFSKAWEEALDYVRHFDRSVLLSGNEFFSTVYRPKRDEFAAKWTEIATTGNNVSTARTSRKNR